jgi:hypothetical protein
VDRVTQDDMTKEDYMSKLRLVYKFRTLLDYQVRKRKNNERKKELTHPAAVF